MGHSTFQPNNILDLLLMGFQLLPDSMACRLYVLIVLIETIVDISIQTDLFIRVREINNTTDNNIGSERLPVYLGIFILAQYVACSWSIISHVLC